MDKEIWKDVKGYEGLYVISNTGRVKSLKRFRVREKELIPLDNGKGYLRIKLSKNKHSKRYMLHRLIAIAFIPNPQNKKYINHINGVKTDNRIENLEWCTTSENLKHAYMTGLRPMRSKKGNKVINTKTKQVFDSIKEASKEKGLCKSYLSLKLRGKIKNNTEYEFYFN